MALTIAIDGPAGSGKSRVAGRVAASLGIAHLDTGAMYRALTLKALREGIAPSDAAEISILARRSRVEVTFDAGGQRTTLDGEDVTDKLHTAPVDSAVSAISSIEDVRARMALAQQALARHQAMVVDGRDIGTIVLPNATHMFYLTADVEVRAKRRHLDYAKGKGGISFEEVLAELRARDKKDIEREVAPLRRAEDAILVDTTALSEAQVVDTLLRAVRGGGDL